MAYISDRVCCLSIHPIGWLTHPSYRMGQLRPNTFPSVLATVEELFVDSPCWPTGRAFFYLGIVPPLHFPSDDARHLTEMQRRRLHHRLAHDLHTAGIHLAARIWGLIRRTFSPYSSSQPSKTLELPAHLSHITSSSSRLNLCYV